MFHHVMNFPQPFGITSNKRMFSKPILKLPEPTLPRSSSTAAQCELPDTGRLKLKRGESVECRAFRKCFADLAGASGILNPGWLAVQLYSRELIGTDLLKESQKPSIEERVKIVKLLSAVEDQILASPVIKFREFLDILQNEPSLQHLVTGLENTHHELSGLGMCTPDIAPLMSIPSNQPCTTCTQPSQCPHHLPPMSVDPNSFPPLPPAKRPRADNILQPQHPLEHTLKPFDIQHDHQTSVGYPWEHNLQSTTPYSSGGQSSAVDTYASYLKSVYARQKLLSYDKWPLVKSRKYINLALIEKDDITKPEAELFMKATIHGNIDDIKKSKRATCISQIGQLSDGSQLKCILVEGAPGVGKSTFAWKLCHRWGKGTLLKQYRLVVLLRLRDKSVRAAKNTSDLFRYHQRHIQQAAVNEIQDTGGKDMLLLFEGYDELTEELRTQNSIFLDIITGRELPEATVLITSRPWASEFLHRECKEYISQHVEILGFTKANIQSYLESTTANEPSLLVGLMKYISCYPHIGSLMYIPLNSAIVVEVYRNSKKDEILVPKTMTELYSSLVRSLLLRHLLDHPVHGKQRKWRVRGFSDLPQDVYQQLSELGRIAYEGILHGQQVIFSDLQEDLETLSLMQCAPELYVDEGAAVSYNFLHLTVQEYLAAFHLSLQPVEEQIKHFRELCNGGRKQVKSHFHMVMRFLSGLRKFSGYLSEVINMFVKKHSDDSVTDVHGVTFDTLQWLFEAQDNDAIAELLGSSNIQPDRPYDSVTLFDCFVLGYSVSHSNCTWRIVLKFCYIGDEGVEMIMQGAVEEETHCTGGISELDLSGNEVTSEGVKTLSSFPAQLINKLEVLNLNDNAFDSGSCSPYPSHTTCASSESA